MSVKRIFVFLAPVIVAAAIFGCSKDHESPTFSKYDNFMNKPVNLVATYNKATDEFKLSWDMPDTNAVKDYLVAWSDSNVFDLGRTADQFTTSLKTEYTLKSLESMKKMGYSAAKDSFIVYFTVSALYSNSTFNEFIGPRAEVDSALIYKK